MDTDSFEMIKSCDKLYAIFFFMSKGLRLTKDERKASYCSANSLYHIGDAILIRNMIISTSLSPFFLPVN